MGAGKGYLTARQLQVLKLRALGHTQQEIAKILKTSRENICILERRAHRNLQRARETIKAFEQLSRPAVFEIKPRVHVLEIPKIILEKADAAGIRLNLNIVQILERVREAAGHKIKGKRLDKPLTVTLTPDGDFKAE